MSRCGIQYLFMEEDDDMVGGREYRGDSGGQVSVRCFLLPILLQKHAGWPLFMASYKGPSPTAEACPVKACLQSRRLPPKPYIPHTLFVSYTAQSVRTTHAYLAVSSWTARVRFWELADPLLTGLFPQPMWSASLFRLVPFPSAPHASICKTHTHTRKRAHCSPAQFP